jgi:hypothetical protein
VPDRPHQALHAALLFGNDLSRMHPASDWEPAHCGNNATRLQEKTNIAERAVVFDQRIRAGASAWTEQQPAGPEGGFFFNG